jgi:hypothetical protein
MLLSAEEILNPEHGTFESLQIEDQIRELVRDAHPGTVVDCQCARVGSHYVAIALARYPQAVRLDSDTATQAGFLECAEAADRVSAMLVLKGKVVERVTPERRVSYVPAERRTLPRISRGVQ